MKFIIDFIGALSKYYRNQTKNSRYKRYPELAQEILETTSGLANNYLKIKKYAEDLFCTGDIYTIDYYLEDYRQHINNEPLDYPICLSSEIKETLPKHHKNFLTFKRRIIKFTKKTKKLTPKKLNSHRLQKKFISDLKRQFRKMIREDGKYSLFNMENFYIKKAILIYLF